MGGARVGLELGVEMTIGREEGGMMDDTPPVGVLLDALSRLQVSDLLALRSSV